MMICDCDTPVVQGESSLPLCSTISLFVQQEEFNLEFAVRMIELKVRFC
jgi:hypothetical protein